jgi:tetratricopeptide (TPR) repeat protein
MWKAGLGIHFEGACHEYPTIGGHPGIEVEDAVIRHDGKPGLGENSNDRNLRILVRSYNENPRTRTAFYIGSTHRDAGRWREAIEWYEKRIALGESYRDEFLFAHLYKARCERVSGQATVAIQSLLKALSIEPFWAEFWMELAYIAYDEKRYWHCIGYCLQCYNAPQPPTQLWREPNKYTDQPCRIISWCYEHMGLTGQAHHWAVIAKHYIGVADQEWDDRIKRLEER